MNKDIISGNTTNRWEKIPYDIVISANDNLVDFGRQTVSVTPDSLFTGGKTLAGPANYGQSIVEVIQRAIVEGRIDVGTVTGVSDGVTTGGTYNTGTGAINFNVSSPGTPFSVLLPNIPTDLSTLTDTTDLLKSYTLQPVGTTSFNLVDENAVVVSSIPFPSGSGADTFMTFAETTGNVVFTSADSLTMVTIPKILDAGDVTLLDVAGNTAATNVEEALAELFGLSHVAATTADSTTIGFTTSGTDNQVITATVIESGLTPANINITDPGSLITATTIEGALQELAAKSHIAATINSSNNSVIVTPSGTDNQTFNLITTALTTPYTPTAPLTATTVEEALNQLGALSHVAMTTTDSGTIDFSVSGTDNQTLTGIIKGADTATVNQIPASDGAGNITWTTPAAGSVVDAIITDGSTNAVEGNAIFDALALKLDVTDLKTYSLAFPDNIVVELRDEDNTLVSSFRRNTFSKADTDAIITTILGTNQVPNENGRNIEYSSTLNIAPAQGGIANALSVIAGQGVYVPTSSTSDGDAWGVTGEDLTTNVTRTGSAGAGSGNIAYIGGGTFGSELALGNSSTSLAQWVLRNSSSNGGLDIGTTDNLTTNGTGTGVDIQLQIDTFGQFTFTQYTGTTFDNNTPSSYLTLDAFGRVTKSQIASAFQWYEGGDSVRVYATYDPFATGYTKNSSGNYSFVVPSGEQLDRLEYQVLPSGANQNITGSGSTIFSVTTPTGNTSILNTSTPNIIINSGGTGGNIANSNTSASGGTTWATTFSAGTLTLTGSSLNSHAGGVISITNLIQNA